MILLCSVTVEQLLSKCQIYENAFNVIGRKASLDFSPDIEYVLIVDRYKLMKIFLKLKINDTFQAII